MGQFQGALVSQSNRDFTHYSVELHSTTSTHRLLERSYVTNDGHFDFRAVPPGPLLLVVKDRNGDTVHEQFTDTQGPLNLAVRLPEPKVEKPGSGVVSVQELQHKPVKAAMKAFERSAKETRTGNLNGSMQLLEQAVALDPEFVQAWNNLGSRYVHAHRFADAETAFRRAIALSPKTPMLFGNLAQALLYQGKFDAAEVAARTALAMDPSDPMAPRAHLALGLALAGKGATADARQTLLLCSQSADELVRRNAQVVLSRLR